MMACVLWTFEVYDVERPWDVTDLLFFRDSEDFFLAAYLCLRLLLIIALAESWKQIAG